VKCKFCLHGFCGGATRIREHIVTKCEATSEAFMRIKEKLLTVSDEKEEKKKQKSTEAEVDDASEVVSYRQAAEKWESDSDSDYTDEEDLMV
jgi:Fe-S-cluster-containing dehydrogenase component